MLFRKAHSINGSWGTLEPSDLNEQVGKAQHNLVNSHEGKKDFQEGSFMEKLGSLGLLLEESSFPTGHIAKR